MSPDSGDKGDAGERGVPGREGVQGREGPQGREGRVGPAGKTAVGTDGLAGQTGATGETGASGSQGRTGAAGATGIGRVGAGILAAIVLGAIVFTGVLSDQRSCRRQADPRAAQRAKYAIDGLRAEQIAAGESGTERTVNLRYAQIYRELATAVPILHCGGAQPDVGPDNTKQVQAILARARSGG